MNSQKLEYYKKKLIKERKNVQDFINQMKNNETINMNFEMASELSFYDNHPSDLASEMNDMERGMAFKEHEITVMKRIDDALKSIENDSYGICQNCKKEIPEERLEFMPYAQFCVTCQKELNTIKSEDKLNRPIEETVLDNPFGYGYNDFNEDGEIGFDAEDSYQAVQRFNQYDNTFELDNDDMDYVEPIEKISNQQYKNQLPD
jgi:YteA family regulatory protein